MAGVKLGMAYDNGRWREALNRLQYSLEADHKDVVRVVELWVKTRRRLPHWNSALQTNFVLLPFGFYLLQPSLFSPLLRSKQQWWFAWIS